MGYCNNQAQNFNSQIGDLAKTELKNRKEKEDKFYAISKMLEIPITRTNPKVIEEIKSIMPEEENYLSYNEFDKNEFELKLKSKNNDGQILKVKIYVFDLSI